MKTRQTKKCIATIPSRGGSKRIPLKSLQRVGDKTLLQRCIEVARDSGVFDEIYVNTDDVSIAEAAELYGAQVPHLRKEYFDDYSPVSLATIQFANDLLKSGRLEGDEYITQLMPNCPFLKASTIIDFTSEATRYPEQSLLSAVLLDPISRFAFELDSKGEHKTILKKTMDDSRTQDSVPLYIPTGAIWVANLEYLNQEGSYYGKNYKFRVIPQIEGFDIDTGEQLDQARILAAGLLTL